MSSSRRGFQFWINAWWPVAFSITVVAIILQRPLQLHALRTPVALGFLHPSSATSTTSLGTPLTSVSVSPATFCGYGLIGLAWLRAWWMTLPHSHFLHDAALGLLGCAAMASLDEWHQTYIPSRTGSAWDVLLDCCGAIVMQLAGLYFHASIQAQAAGTSCIVQRR